PSGPPTGDAVSGCDQVVYALCRGVEGDPVQDVGHCGCPSCAQAATRTSVAVESVGAPDGRAVIAIAVSAASTAKITHAHRAGRNRAATGTGRPRWPCAANTALAFAIEKPAPKRCAM